MAARSCQDAIKTRTSPLRTFSRLSANMQLAHVRYPRSRNWNVLRVPVMGRAAGNTPPTPWPALRRRSGCRYPTAIWHQRPIPPATRLPMLPVLRSWNCSLLTSDHATYVRPMLLLMLHELSQRPVARPMVRCIYQPWRTRLALNSICSMLPRYSKPRRIWPICNLVANMLRVICTMQAVCTC